MNDKVSQVFLFTIALALIVIAYKAVEIAGHIDEILHALGLH